MVSFVIAGKASDPSFARAEYAAKQVQAMVPNIFVQLEMKRPDHWKSFLATISRLYDFSDYPDDFSGPLVWTLEGGLIGGAADFVQKICIEQFGIQDPPAVTDPMFKEIAAENLKQVKMQLQREQDGPGVAERCASAHASAQEGGLIEATNFSEKRHFFSHGACIEVWINSSVVEEAKANGAAFGAGESAPLDPRLAVCKVGQEESHTVLLHPKPLFPKQMALVPSRFLVEATPEVPAEEVAPEAEAPAPEQAPPEAPDVEAEALDQAAPAPAAPPSLLVPPHRFRSDAQEDLSLADFTAAVELLSQFGGVAVWSAIRGGSEFRHPLETHLQVLPFPQTGSPLRYPLEFLIDRCMREGPISTLPCFPFEHFLLAVPQADGAKPAETAKSIAMTYDSALTKLQGIRQGASRLLCFTTTWMLVMPLTPPEPGTPEHEVWLKLPPLHPCALCGIAICPEIDQTFPETAGGQLRQQRLVSSRAEEEGIPEDAPEYGLARNEVRISRQIYDRPLETLGFWVK